MERRNRRHGFTLVELLAVVGIIAVIIGILVPVLSRAREQARAVKCMANLHSIGQALSAYVVQTEHFPGAMTHDDQRNIMIWTVRLQPFLGSERSVFNCPSRGPEYECSLSNMTVANPIAGQSSQGALTFGYRAGDRIWCALTGTYFCYGYNAGGTDYKDEKRGLGGWIHSPWDGGNSYFTSEVRFSKVKSPGDMVAIAESPDMHPPPFLPNCMVVTPAASYNISGGRWDDQPPSPVHYGGLNVLFADGHVQRFRPAEITLPDYSSRTPDSLRIAAMWNVDHKP